MSDSNENIDLIEYGKLLAAVSSLTESCEALTIKVDSITERLNTGKGVIFGMMLAAGGLGAGVTDVLSRLFEK